MIRILYALLLFSVISGCSKTAQSPIWELEQTYLGAISMNVSGSLEAEFTLPERIDHSFLVFVIRGATNEAAIQSTITAARQVRARLEVFDTKSLDPLCRADLNPTNNLIPCYWYNPDFSLLVNEIEPFLYDATPNPNENYSIGVVFPHGRNTSLLRDGRLLPGQAYSLKVTILQGVPIPNQVEIWLQKRIWTQQIWESMNDKTK